MEGCIHSHDMESYLQIPTRYHLLFLLLSIHKRCKYCSLLFFDVSHLDVLQVVYTNCITIIWILRLSDQIYIFFEIRTEEEREREIER